MDNAIDILLEKRHELWLLWKNMKDSSYSMYYANRNDPGSEKSKTRIIIDELDYAVKALLEKKNEIMLDNLKSCL